MFEAVGGAMQSVKLAMLPFVYVIDKEDNKLTTVSTEYMKDLLSSNPELLAQY